MEKISSFPFRATFVFLTSIIVSIFGYLNPGNQFLAGFLLGISITWLLTGWYFLKDYFPEGHPFLLFFFGYLYASVFMTFTFVIASWPLARIFIIISPVWPLILVATVFAIREKLPKEGLIQFLIEAGIMIAFIIIFLIKA